MARQKKQLLLLVLLLVLFLVCYGILDFHAEYQATKEAEQSQEETYQILSLTQEEIQTITYDYQGISYLFAYDTETETWTYPEDPSLDIEESSLNILAKRVAELEGENKIENVTDLSQYGLTDPSKTIQVTTDKETVTLYLGDYNSMITRYYLYVEGREDTVYTITSLLNTSFSKTLEDVTVEPEETEEKTEAELESTESEVTE